MSAPSALLIFVYDSVLVTEDIVGKRLGDLFSAEDIAELVELGRVVRIIRARLVAQGKMPAKIKRL